MCDSCDYIPYILLGLLMGMVLCGITILIVDQSYLTIDNSVGDTICEKITGNISTASTQNSKLVCTTPSYDSTLNIIIKSNGDR